MRPILRVLWLAALTVLGLVTIYLLSTPTRRHLGLIAHALRGDQQWDEEARRRILSSLVLSQLSGGDEGRWWLHHLDGLSRLPVDSVKDRHDSIVRLASTLPERSAEWLPGPDDVGNSYERFLRALIGEELKRADLSAAETKAFVEYQQMSHSNLPRDPNRPTRVEAQQDKSIQTVLRSLSRSHSPGEAAKALQAFLPFKQFPGGLREAVYSEPGYDEEVDYEKLGTLAYAHQTLECDGSVQRLGSPGPSAQNAHIQVLTEVREYTIKRPWLNEALLEEYRSTFIPGEHFFGEGGSLHLLPTEVLLTLGPRYVVSLTPGSEQQLRPWIDEGQCCTVQCNGKTATLNTSRVFIDNHRLTGVDASARAESFALISRVY